MVEKIGAGTSEKELRNAGFAPMSVDALLARVLGNTVWGDYLYGYRYVNYFGPDGALEGTNNAGSYNTGRWQADADTNCLNIEWNQSWVPASLVAYEVGDVVHFFDQGTGLWHSNFHTLRPGKQPLEV